MCIGGSYDRTIPGKYKGEQRLSEECKCPVLVLPPLGNASTSLASFSCEARWNLGSFPILKLHSVASGSHQMQGLLLGREWKSTQKMNCVKGTHLQHSELVNLIPIVKDIVRIFGYLSCLKHFHEHPHHRTSTWLSILREKYR